MGPVVGWDLLQFLQSGLTERIPRCTRIRVRVRKFCFSSGFLRVTPAADIGVSHSIELRMTTRPLLSMSLPLLLLLLMVFLLMSPATAQQQGEDGARVDDEAADVEKEEAGDDATKLKIDPEMVRDAIASLLRDGAAGAGEGDQKTDGYAEAAQEYLEHVQSTLATVKSPSELYVRDQLADLETLDALLSGLEAAGGGGGARLLPEAGARLATLLVKGPARELLPDSPQLTSADSDQLTQRLEPSTFPTAYAGSGLAGRLTEAAAALRSFLDSASASLADDLRQFADSQERVPAGRTRDYLDSVLDRVLELEGRQVKVNVDWPTEDQQGGDGGISGQPRVSLAPPPPEEGGTSSAGTDADEGGRRLFDHVLSRRAVASVAALLTAKDPSRATVEARIGELQRRRYQPGGLAAMLEAIKDCLA